MLSILTLYLQLTTLRRMYIISVAELAPGDLGQLPGLLQPFFTKQYKETMINILITWANVGQRRSVKTLPRLLELAGSATLLFIDQW